MYDCDDADYFPVTFVNKNKKSLIDNWNPHYTNSVFRTVQTIWGSEAKDLHYDYSDRLREWDYAKHSEACKIASEKHKERTAAWVQCMLSHFYGHEVEIAHVMAGYNLSNGFSYRVYGSRKKNVTEA